MLHGVFDVQETKRLIMQQFCLQGPMLLSSVFYLSEGPVTGESNCCDHSAVNHALNSLHANV